MFLELRISKGKEFQIVGAAKLNARIPVLEVVPAGMQRYCWLLERNLRPGVYISIKDFKYSGAILLRHLKVKRATLYLIL